jgi:hypothetical protein
MTNTHQHPAVTLNGIRTIFENSSIAQDAKHAVWLAHIDVRLLV